MSGPASGGANRFWLWLNYSTFVRYCKECFLDHLRQHTKSTEIRTVFILSGGKVKAQNRKLYFPFCAFSLFHLPAEIRVKITLPHTISVDVDVHAGLPHFFVDLFEAAKIVCSVILLEAVGA